MKIYLKLVFLFSLIAFLCKTNSQTKQMKKIALLTSLLLTIFLFGCNNAEKTKETRVELNTTMGMIVLQLSDKTPLHRDNFVKLVNEGYYNGMLFHRVIEGFGIQSGDPDSKDAKPGEALGNGGPGYTIPAEINDTLFHKRGALNAARDGNPEQASAGSQFFIVQGRFQTDSTLDRAEKRINLWLAQKAYINAPANKALKDSLQHAIDVDNEEAINRWTDSMIVRSTGYTDFKPYHIPEAHRKVYKEQGGAPHLDQNYTVWGEVIEGMDVVDAIAEVETDSLDRPVDDVRIISARVVKR